MLNWLILIGIHFLPYIIPRQIGSIGQPLASHPKKRTKDTQQ
jgi:hypothetical protein